MPESRMLLYILVMALVTYLIRALPLTLIRGRLPGRFFQSFLNYLPYSVLAAMTFPAIFHSTGDLLSGLAGTAVALILSLMGQNLMVAAVGASLVAYLLLLL